MWLRVFVITSKKLEDLTFIDMYGNRMSLIDWKQKNIHTRIGSNLGINEVFPLKSFFESNSDYKKIFDIMRDCNCILLDLKDFKEIRQINQKDLEEICQKGQEIKLVCPNYMCLQSAIALGICLGKKRIIYGCIGDKDLPDPFSYMRDPEIKDILPISNVVNLERFFEKALNQILLEENIDKKDAGDSFSQDTKFKG